MSQAGDRPARPGGGPPGTGTGGRWAASTVHLGQLVQALSEAETVDQVARVIAEAGAVPAGAEFANIAVVNPGGDGPGTARLYHASSLTQVIAQRYATIALDDITPLGTVMRADGEVWLGSLDDIESRYPALRADTAAAGLAATASLALHGRDQRVIGPMGLAWARPQAFTEAQRSEVRVVAGLAADALSRTQRLEAERGSRERAERLQRTMTALVASDSLSEVSAAVFRDGLPFGASAAWLALADQGDPGSLATLAAVGLTGRATARWETLTAAPYREAMAASAPVYLATEAELADRYPDAHGALAGPGHQAWIALPLPGSGRPLGALVLAFPHPHPVDDRRDQLILTALGSAVADALGRAIRHDADRDLVMSVQRSLLPKTLPEHPRVALGAYYAPAELRYGLGGDWYDAVPLPGGRLMLIVGDVTGHGLDAAIAMGQLRSASRALGPTHDPAALLDALDQFAVAIPDMWSATVAVAVIDPAARTVRYALAGHPPPLLRGPDGTVTALAEASGPLVGFGVAGRREKLVSFQAGSALVLFTDGLVERRDEAIDVGFARLAAALAAASARDPAGLCKILSDQSLQRPGREDDTAILSAFLS